MTAAAGEPDADVSPLVADAERRPYRTIFRLALPARSEPSTDPETGLPHTTLEVLPYQHLFRDDESAIFRPSWAPDGSRIAFRIRSEDAGSEIAILTLSDLSVARLVLDGEQSAPAWSPDGGLIAFVTAPTEGAARSDIFTMAPDGSDLVQRTTDEAPGLRLNPAWFRRRWSCRSAPAWKMSRRNRWRRCAHTSTGWRLPCLATASMFSVRTHRFS